MVIALFDYRRNREVETFLLFVQTLLSCSFPCFDWCDLRVIFIFMVVGQHNDARMNLAIALTATRHGAAIANHVRVVDLLKERDESGKLVVKGAHVKDELTGKEWDIRASCVINATGPFTDSIRQMDNPEVKQICCPSSGVHVVLPGYYR